MSLEASPESIVPGLLEWGHFTNTRYGDHINGRLRKERLFNQPEALAELLLPMHTLVHKYQPGSLIGVEEGGAVIARQLGRIMSLPALGFDVSDKTETSEQVRELVRPVLIEDNVIKGNTLQSALRTLQCADVVPIAAVVLFKCGLGQITSTNVPIEFVYELNIMSWPSGECYCQSVEQGLDG